MRADAGQGSVFKTTVKKKDGREYPYWCASWSLTDANGKRVFIRGFGTTQVEAIKRRGINMQRKLARDGEVVRKQRSPRLSDYLTTWLDDYPPDKLSDEVRRKYRRDIEHHVLPHLDPMIADLSADDLKHLFYRTLPSTATNAARWNAYKTLRNMLNHAVKHGVIALSPLALVEAPRLDTKVREGDDKWINRRVSMTKGLLKWLADPSNEYHDHYPRILMMFLGLRRGELLGLEWSCFNNLDRKGKATFVVKQQLQRRNGGVWFIKPQTKSGKSRTIPLPELWRQALLVERAKGRKVTDFKQSWARDLVFVTADSRWVDYNTHSDAWMQILNAYVNHRRTVKSPIDDTYYFRPHAARHVAASMLFDEGIPLEVAQEILGHSDKIMTLYYTHMTRAKKQEALESLGTALSERMKPDNWASN